MLQCNCRCRIWFACQVYRIKKIVKVVAAIIGDSLTVKNKGWTCVPYNERIDKSVLVNNSEERQGNYGKTRNIMDIER